MYTGKCTARIQLIMPFKLPKFCLGDFVKFKCKEGDNWGNIIEKVYEPIEERWIYRIDTDDTIYYFEESLTLMSDDKVCL
jgi:hypothetical protein